jgi:cobyrinic acid a,c-diamide synthase
MPNIPRLAVGAVDETTDTQPMLWALMEALARLGLDVQSFSSQARFVSHDGSLVITGQRRRHLDSWLMSADVCRELFRHGARTSDLAVIDGVFDTARSDVAEGGRLQGGSFDTVCDWLDAPRLAVLDAASFRQGFGPPRPEKLDGVLIDKVCDSAEACRLQTTIEALWGVPVLSTLELLPNVRAVIRGLRRGCAPSRELCRALGQSLAARMQTEKLWNIASSRPLPAAGTTLFCEGVSHSPLNIAVAVDDVFQYYFPDTLDLLEGRGATLCDFSPLRDDRLPRHTDMVYFGCGHPEYYASALAGNHCMKQSLRNHVRAGGRILAECGGVAYLCEQLETEDGRRLPMAGVLPALARVKTDPSPCRAVEVTLDDDTWLGEAGMRLRGYRNDGYTLEPTGPLNSHIREADHRLDLVGDSRVIASRIHLDFAAQASLLDRFFHPLPQYSVVS